jgi:hypothetical protein
MVSCFRSLCTAYVYICIYTHYIQTSIPSLPILLEYVKDTQHTLVDIMDERETLAFTVCVYRCNGGMESSREREKKQTKRKLKEETHVCVHSL